MEYLTPYLILCGSQLFLGFLFSLFSYSDFNFRVSMGKDASGEAKAFKFSVLSMLTCFLAPLFIVALLVSAAFYGIVFLLQGVKFIVILFFKKVRAFVAGIISVFNYSYEGRNA